MFNSIHEIITITAHSKQNRIKGTKPDIYAELKIEARDNNRNVLLNQTPHDITAADKKSISCSRLGVNRRSRD